MRSFSFPQQSLKLALPLLLALVLVLGPLLTIVECLWEPADIVFDHLVSYSLVPAMVETLKLLGGVLCFTLIFGVGLSALVQMFEFPGRSWFQVIFALPLAVPTYVMAFVVIGLLDYSGPLMSALRAQFPGWTPPEVRGSAGAVFAFSLCLYPYVYLLSGAAFKSLSLRGMEVSRGLGLGPWRSFFRVTLPMCRAWIASGLVLVSMETLADFGGVAAFNVNTFTTMIYKSWFGLGSFNAAARMSLMLLLPALTLLGLQTWLARRQRQVDMGSGRSRRIPLRGAKACLAVAVSTLVSTVVFVIPVLQLSLWAAGGGQYRHFQLSDLMHSLLQSLAVALMVIACALVLVATRRFFRSWLLDRCIEFSTLGYALPGTVLAVAFYRWCSVVDGFSVLPWLLGSLAPLLLGLSSRYMSVGVQSIQSGMGRVSPDLDLASRSLGRGPLWTHVTVHWPMMKGSFGAALVLVFVDVMKEMPMTLMTRPLGWDTLSVRIFEFTSEGDWEHAAVPALILIVAGLVPLLLLRRFTGEST